MSLSKEPFLKESLGQHSKNIMCSKEICFYSMNSKLSLATLYALSAKLIIHYGMYVLSG